MSQLNRPLELWSEGRVNHADHENVRFLQENPPGFDGDYATGGGHVGLRIVSGLDCIFVSLASIAPRFG